MRKMLILAAALVLAMQAGAYAATMPHTPRNEGVSSGLDAVRGVDSKTSVVTIYGRTSGGAAYTTSEAGYGNTGGALVWDGDSAFTHQSSGYAVEIKSGDTGDSETGPGARTVLVSGINSSYAAQSETVTLDGTTGASTTNRNYLQINSITVSTAGGQGSNVAAITARETSGGDRVGVIDAFANRTRTGAYCVPLNYDGYITQLNIGTDDTADCIVRVEKLVYGGVWTEVAREYVYAGTKVVNYEIPIHIDEKEFVRIRAMSCSDATTDIAVRADLYLVSE